jgi:hypothetical protein
MSVSSATSASRDPVPHPRLSPDQAAQVILKPLDPWRPHDPGRAAGQVFLASPPDPPADRGERIVPGSSERADRDRDQAGQRIDPPPCGERGQAAPPDAATYPRPDSPRRDRTRPRAHPRATMPLRARHTSLM